MSSTTPPGNPAPADRAGRDLSAVLTPRRVAVVGASARAGTPGHTLWQNLRTFPGDVVPVSRSADMIDGVPAFADLASIPGHVDLAVVAVAADAAVDVVREAAACGVGACVVVSAGFAECGEDGRARQELMVSAARAAGMPVVGPNCLGVQNLALPLNASLAAGTATGGKGISIITQSGSYAMAVHAMAADEGVPFAVAYSSGNRADVDDFEVVEHLAHDPNTRVTCLYAESIGDGRALVDVLRLTTDTTPVVVSLTGRSAAGARAAASHTAAVAGDRRAWDDVLESAGAVVAHSGQEMIDIARALATQPPPAGRRAAIVTNSGGVGTELADLLASAGVELPTLSAAVQEQLRALLPPHGSAVNPVDLTPAWNRFDSLYPAAIDLLARSGEVDLIIPVLLHRSAEEPAVARAVVDVVERLRADAIATPVYACWVARRSAWHHSEHLVSAGIPCFEWPDRTARAVAGAVRHGVRARAEAPSAVRRRALPREVGREVQATEKFLRDHGIPVADSTVHETVAAAVAAARLIDGPVVLKVEHPDLTHRSDVGGVQVGLESDDAVERAATDLLALAAGARVRVQPRLRGAELLVGAIDDPTFGPVVAVGLGGVLVELLDETAFAAAPLTPQQAHRLLDRPRIRRLLAGFRGSPPARLGPLVATVCAVGSLIALYDEIAELDLNPLLVGADGCVAVDVRLVRADR